ncbi:MAG TPA: MFS transporter [Bacteroidales bacterium]|nr:MFS transporter [Bacteroidales bacterium]
MTRFLSAIDGNERRVFKLHLAYALLEGVTLGVLALNEFVFVKSLRGSSYQLGLLFQFSMMVFLFLVFLNEFLRRMRRRRELLRYAFLFSRLPLLLIAFFPVSLSGVESQPWWHAVFLGLFLVYYLGTPIIFPSINLLLKHNYAPENFGRLYSISTSAGKVVMLVVTFIYGYWLDHNPYIFVSVFPVLAILGVISGFILAEIPFPQPESERPSRSFLSSVRDSINNMVNVLKENEPYRHFEIGFMIYGFGFMATVTVIILFFYEGLNLSYSSVAFYRNVYNILAIILLPFFGKLIGILGPRRFATISYGSVALYVSTLILTQWWPASFQLGMITIYYGLIAYVLFHGIFAATMPLLWNIGSAYFCKPSEAGLYQEIHLSLTGFRAIFAPLLGVVFYEWLGFTLTFLIGIIILISSIVFMAWSYYQVPLARFETLETERLAEEP